MNTGHMHLTRYVNIFKYVNFMFTLYIYFYTHFFQFISVILHILVLHFKQLHY